jgi:hypothetical protein
MTGFLYTAATRPQEADERVDLQEYKAVADSLHKQSRVEAASNTSTVALRVVRGDEKGPNSWG